MASLPAEFQPAIGRDARTVAGLSREADGSICAVWMAAIGGLALAFLLFFEPAGLAATMIYANAGGLALCLLAALGRYLGCTLRARRIATAWKRLGVVFLPGSEGLVEYDGAVHDPAPPTVGGER